MNRTLYARKKFFRKSKRAVETAKQKSIYDIREKNDI